MGELIRDLKRELREEILQGMSYERQMTDEELAQVIDGKILEQMEREPMALRDRLRLQKELFDSFRRLDILQELVDEMKIFGIKAGFHVRKGAASKEILRIAEKEDVSLIVMAKTGAGLVKGLVMGSTAQNVTLNSERSLLLLPPENAADD